MKKLALLLCTSLFLWTACESDLGSDPTTSSPEGTSSVFGSDDNTFGNNGGGDPTGSGQPNEIIENPFVETTEESISTFSIDADGASYSNSRRLLVAGQLPHHDVIRTEELVNYFNYDYPNPTGSHPIGLEGEISTCPWAESHKLVRIGIKGREIVRQQYPASNLVFLVDVSGSMNGKDELGLLKEGFKLMVDQLRWEDRISLVTYASNPRVVLPSVSGSDKETIRKAIDDLSAGGSTNGEGGILTAYDIAEANFIEGGNNRIILATDGDFNVGVSSQEELVELIEVQREKDIFLTVLGVGRGHYQEGKMEQLANNGNGNFEYLDNIDQCRKVFIDEYNKFFAVAKDVKVQVEFNPEVVKAYRLIGYENRLLTTEEFEDDTKDAGEIGAGQCITALYEIIPASDPNTASSAFTIDFRYKFPTADTSIPISMDIYDEETTFESASDDHRFAAAVAAFGLQLRDSEYKGEITYQKISNWAEDSRSYDPYGYKAQFSTMVNMARNL